MSAVQPLDRFLELLRRGHLPYRWHESRLNTWEAVCPACLAPEWGLTIIDHGRAITLRCRSGCTEKAIMRALKDRPALERLEQAVQLAEAASEIAHRALDLAAEGVGA